MAGELQAFTDSGLTLYAVLLNNLGQAYNGATFETINASNWATYDIALTEGTAGIYIGTMPAVAAGVYGYTVYSRLGGSPAITDDLIGNGSIQWSGTAEIPLSSLDAVGSGAISWTIAVTDGVNPLDGVEVWATTDLAGSNIVASGTTDTAGEVTFTLDAGAYYAWKQLSGYNFTNPQAFTVS